jgi:hypothetical protein
MSDNADKPNRQRWGWSQWSTVALLGYLWSWLILMGLDRFHLLGDNETLAWIGYVVYWPLIQLRYLINRFR